MASNTVPASITAGFPFTSNRGAATTKAPATAAFVRLLPSESYCKFTGTDWPSIAFTKDTVKPSLPLVPAAFLLSDLFILPVTRVPCVTRVFPFVSVMSY